MSVESDTRLAAKAIRNPEQCTDDECSLAYGMVVDMEAGDKVVVPVEALAVIDTVRSQLNPPRASRDDAVDSFVYANSKPDLSVIRAALAAYDKAKGGTT